MTARLVVPASALAQLVWCCVRCGKDDGVARSTVPLGGLLEDPDARRALFEPLVQRILDYHRRVDGCVAAATDIFLQPRQTKE